jgi:type I restriction enzyme S subunit
VTPTDLGKLNGMAISESARRISDKALQERSLPRIPRNAVVMSSRAPIGHLAIAGCDLYTNQGCKSFVCGEDLDSEFLFFALRHRMSAIQALGSGATFVEVSKSALEDFEISYPSVDEQRRIAARLKAQLAEVDTARQAAQAQVRDAVLLRSRLLQQAFDALRDAPRKVLGEWARTTSGSTPPRGDKRYWSPADIPWVKTGEVAFAPITATEEAISRQALAECSLILLPPQTVLIAMYGQGKTRGQSAILQVEATTNQACFAILPNDTWDKDFLHHWLMVSYEDLRSLSDGRGGNQANLNGALLNALEIPAPDIDEQRRLVGRLKAQLAEAAAIHQGAAEQLAEIERLPQRLLAQAFTPPVAQGDVA